MLLLRMGFNAGDRWSPQSSFIVCVCGGGGFTANPDCFQCSLPEATCCPVALYSLPFNAVVGGMGMHSYSMHSSARYFLVTACLCSDTLIFRVLLVSPMYILYIYVYLSQSLQGTWYATSFFFSLGVFCFTLTSSYFRVSWLKDSLHPKGCTSLL